MNENHCSGHDRSMNSASEGQGTISRSSDILAGYQRTHRIDTLGNTESRRNGRNTGRDARKPTGSGTVEKKWCKGLRGLAVGGVLPSSFR